MTHAPARVLFLDDMESRHTAFFEHAKISGVIIDQAYSAKEAIQFLNANEYDQVFLDHDLSLDDIMCEVGAKTREPTGMAVVDHIVEKKIRIPYVIVHSHNGPASEQMMRRLVDCPSVLKVSVIPFGELLNRIRK